MEFLFFVWDDRPGRSIDKCARHGLSLDDVEQVLNAPIQKTTSRSSSRPLHIGFAPDGRLIAVVFDRLDAVTAQPVTAYPIDED